jgi:hypothetical protein
MMKIVPALAASALVLTFGFGYALADHNEGLAALGKSDNGDPQSAPHQEGGVLTETGRPGADVCAGSTGVEPWVASKTPNAQGFDNGVRASPGPQAGPFVGFSGCP